MSKAVKFSLAASVAMAGLFACAEMLDRPEGIRIGQRMTLRPYVSLSLTYDSNVGSTHDGDRGDALWTVSPGLGLTYNGDSWSLLLSGYYNYRQYCKSSNDRYNRHSYGESARFNWSNASGGGKGWTLLLGQSFQQVTMGDDLVLGDGRNYSMGTRRLQVQAALQRRFNEYWHGDVNASYYWLDYMNDTRDYNSLYGWERALVGGEVGFAPSRWTDFIVSGNYHTYDQDNAHGTTLSSRSQGYSVQAGLGSYMTERVSYRALAGWSRFEYANDASSSDGFVYTVSGNWKIGETWNTMLLASSYYHPSERQRSSKSRSDALSWGLAKLMIRGKLRATLDLRYRHETVEHITTSGYDYCIDVITGRIGFSYTFNRFLSGYLHGEYQRSWNDNSGTRNGAYDYDRWRITTGIRVSY
ncbi:MAG: hypothetical protein J6T01_06100 [Kiritimatiellae bacterium]|nr:hypothetical protein [Kiritimatiellia bacterium]